MTTEDGGRGRRLFIERARRVSFLCRIEHRRLDARPADSFHSPLPHRPGGSTGDRHSLAGLVAVPP